jgi:hypothetical protein
VFNDGYMTVNVQTASGNANPFAHTTVNDPAEIAFSCSDIPMDPASAAPNAPFNKDAFATYLRQHIDTAHEFGNGNCVPSVRDAMCRADAGGLGCEHSAMPGDWPEKFLKPNGFSAVASGIGTSNAGDNPHGYPAGYTPQKGDIAVFVYPSYPNGHVCGWDGSNWISDFVQQDIQPNVKKGSNRTYTIYRRP